jgi:class 3 adenylate cyclase/tetratricopeptide (TPR) repeat protein
VTCACGHVNPDHAKFCLECGAALLRQCAACTVELPASAKFCLECGQPVGTQETAASPARHEVRKIVTILFADLAGSTSLQEHMDPESVRRVMDRFYATMRAEVEAAGGVVVKFTGDGVMAGFGIREAREDDALRAVRAALAMQESFAAFADEIHDKQGAQVSLRVGVNTGEVVVSDEDDDVVGDVVNVAARLEHAAGSGNVLAGDGTWRLTRHAVTFEPVAPLDLKGKAEAVPAHRVLSLVAPADDDGLAAPYVGRTGEMTRLHEIFERSATSGRPALVTVVGSPGLGKTRLASEFIASVAGRALVLEAKCDPAGTATYAPIAEALRAVAGIPDTASADEVVRAFDALTAEEVAERARVAKLLASLLGVGNSASPEETFWAVRRLLEGLARGRPVLVVVDDVHWAEPMLLDLLEHVVEWANAAIVVFALARPEIREVRPALLDAGAIVLEGLDPDDTASLALSLLGAHDLPDALVRRILATTEGNPLFVRELLRMLVDDGVLSRDGGERWVVTVEADEIDVPPTIHALLSARIERLREDERAVVERAAVVGKEFYRGAVIELVPPAVRPGIDTHLETLRRKELVEPEGTYWIDERVFRFHHVLIRDAAYRRLLKEARAELHERFADWLEGKVGELVGEHSEVLGYHLEQAHSYLADLGVLDHRATELGQRASMHLVAATRRALDRDDLAAAANLSGRALGLSRDPSVRAQLLLDRCEALLAMGDVGTASEAVAELRALASDDRLVGWADCFDGQLAILTDPVRLRATAALVEHAARRLSELRDTNGAAKAHAVHAQALAHLGQFGACEAALDRALAAAREAGDRRRANAVLSSAPLAALWGPSPVARASGRCLDVVRVLRITAGAPAVEATALRCQAVLEAMRGRTDAAHRMLASARNTLEELGLGHALVECDLYCGLIDLLSGDAAGAEASLRKAFDGFRSLNVGTDVAQAAALLARSLVELGRDDEALALTDESERLGGDDLKTAIAWRTVRARLLARRGDVDTAIELARAAVSLAEATDALIDHADARLALGEVLAAAGRTAEAETQSRAGRDLYARKEAQHRDDRVAAPPVEAACTGTPERGRTGGVRAAPGVDGGSAVPLLTRYRNALISRRWDEISALYAPDHVMVDRRRGLMSELVGARAWTDALRATWQDEESDWDFEILGAWSDGLHLTRVRSWGPAWERSYLLVVVKDDEVAYRTEIFDEEDQDTAFARLDELAYEESRVRQVVEREVPVATTGMTAAGVAALVRVADAGNAEYPEGAFLVVERGGDSLTRVERFDQEVAARQRLQEITPNPSCVSWLMRHHFERHSHQDWEALRRLNEPDFVLVDHRPVGWGVVRGFDQVLEFIQEGARTAQMVPGCLPITEWISITPEAALFRYRWQGTNDAGVEFSFDRLMLARPRRGRGTRTDVFDPDQLDEARRLMASADVSDRVGGARQRSTRTTLFEDYARRWEAAFNAGGGPALAAVYAPEFEAREHGHHIALDRATHLEMMQGAASRLGMRATVDILVCLGQRHGVGRTTFSLAQDLDLAYEDRSVAAPAKGSGGSGGPSEIAVISAIRVDENARTPRFETFPPELLHRALARAEELYLEDEATGEAAAGARRRIVQWRMCDAQNEGDLDALASAFAPGVVFVDRRPVGWGTVEGRDAVMEVFRAVRYRSVQHTWSITEVHAVADDGCVYTLPFAGTDEEGGSYEGGRVLVTHLTDEGMARVDLFPQDDVEGALAYFHERQREAPLSPPTAVSTHERIVGRDGALSNAYTEAFQRCLRTISDGDWDRLSALYASDIVVEDRRAGLQHVLRHPEEVVGMLQESTHFAYSLGRMDVVAVRGERLAIHRILWRLQDDAEVEMLVVGELDEHGRISASIHFDGGDLEAALAELDRRYVAQLPPLEAAVFSVLPPLAAAYNAHDWSGYLSAFHDDVEVVDGRPAGWGVLHGAEEVGSHIRTLIDLVPDAWALCTSVERISGQAVVARVVTRGTDTNGGRVEITYFLLFVVRDGKIARWDLFPFDQHDRALARFDDLTKQSTTIARAWDRLIATMNARDFVSIDELHAPTFVMHDRTMGHDFGRGEFLTSLEETLRTPGSFRPGRSVIVGDRHGLIELIWSQADEVLELANWYLTRCDADGRFVRADRFRDGQLLVAMARAEELYLEDEASGAEAEWSRHRVDLWRAFIADNEGDWDTWQSLVDPEAVVVDRSALGWGEVTSDGVMERQEALSTLTDEHRLRLESVAIDGDVVMTHVVVEGTSKDGGTFEMARCVIQVGTTYQEHFAADEHEEAARRFRELAEESRRATVASPRTTIEQTWQRLLAAMNARDFDVLRDLHAPEFVLRDHVYHFDFDLEAQLGNLRNVLGQDGEYAPGPAVYFGDRHAVGQMTWSGALGSVGLSEVPNWYVTRCGTDGRYLTVEVYSDDDVFDALERAEELYLEDEAAGEAVGWSGDRIRMWRYCRAFNSGDIGEHREWLAPDLVAVDHRPAGFGVLHGREAWLGWLEELGDQAPDRRYGLSGARIDRGVCLLDMVTTGTRDPGGRFEIPVIVVLTANGSRMELFHPEQREEAERRFDELVEGSGSGARGSRR